MYIEKYFFHADTERYSENLKRALVIVIVPILALCTFCAVNILLNFSPDFVKLLILVVMGSILFGMLFTFAAVYIADKLKRRHAKFTFFDIVPSGMVYSEYAGEFTRYGERIILRKLCYIPFSGLESVSRNAKETPRSITLNGEIRQYFFESDRLGYHINEDGELEFDTLILNVGLYTTNKTLVIRESLGNTKRLEKSILYYWEEYKNIPKKKPFDITEFVAKRRRVKPKTSNPALEAPSFSRKWQ